MPTRIENQYGNKTPIYRDHQLERKHNFYYLNHFWFYNYDFNKGSRQSVPWTPEIMVMAHDVIIWKPLPHYWPFVRGSTGQFLSQGACNVESVSMPWCHHVWSLLLASHVKMPQIIDERSCFYLYYKRLYVNQRKETAVLLSLARGIWEISPVKLPPLMRLIEAFKWQISQWLPSVIA